MKSSIVIQHVNKHFRDHVVLNDVNMQMTGGNIYGIIGRNGSGKTILMKCICGFTPVDSGLIRVNDCMISQRNIISEDIGAIIETPGFLPYLSGFDNLKTLALFRRRVDDDHIKRMMIELGLEPNSRKPVRKYSLGMKQKLGIIQALMEDLPILILDEPMNSLDHETVDIVRELLLNEKKKGKLIMVTSHVRDDIDCLCNEVYEITNGIMTRTK